MNDVNIIRAFGVLNRTFTSYITAAIADLDLSYSDSIFLVNIGDKEGLTQEEIARSMAIDKAAVARSVKNMMKKDYLRSVNSEYDKRSKALYLTDAGKRLFMQLQHLNRQWLGKVLAELDPKDMSVFLKTLDQISHRAKMPLK